ncbi:MAG: NAD-dependent epimerase/dehydratase family protein [Alphaproteobacteria bacterium]
MSLAGQTFSVLGADGAIGRALCRHLAARGATVRAFGRADDSYFSAPLGRAVYAIGLTADYARRPFDTVEAHVSLFARLLKDAAFDSMTYLSSTRLYDAGRDGREDAPLVLSPQNPRHLYDLTKAVGESLCLTAGRANVRAARLASVYADDLAGENFLHDLVRRAKSSAAIELASHPRAARDYIHIDDACDALAAIAISGRRQIYNVASGENVANIDLFAWASRLSGCRIAATVDADTPCEAAPDIDISALREDFGLRPRRLADALPALFR